MNYVFYKNNEFSMQFLPLKNYRSSIEQYLNKKIPFKLIEELLTDDILILFTLDIFRPSNILKKIIDLKNKIIIINTEYYKNFKILEIYKSINKKNNIYLIEYNILNINKIKLDFCNINYYFIPQLYSKHFEDIYKEKFIEYQNRKYDILFLGGGAETISRRKKIIKELNKNLKIKIVQKKGIEVINKLIANSKIVLNIYAYDENKIFDYFRNSYLLSNKVLLISEYPDSVDLSIENNLKGYQDNLIFFKYNKCYKVIKKYLKISNEKYKEIVNKQYEWFKKQNNMDKYLMQIF